MPPTLLMNYVNGIIHSFLDMFVVVFIVFSARVEEEGEGGKIVVVNC